VWNIAPALQKAGGLCRTREPRTARGVLKRASLNISHPNFYAWFLTPGESESLQSRDEFFNILMREGCLADAEAQGETGRRISS
jgi:hypothetical protein